MNFHIFWDEHPWIWTLLGAYHQFPLVKDPYLLEANFYFHDTDPPWGARHNFHNIGETKRSWFFMKQLWIVGHSHSRSLTQHQIRRWSKCQVQLRNGSVWSTGWYFNGSHWETEILNQWNHWMEWAWKLCPRFSGTKPTKPQIEDSLKSRGSQALRTHPLQLLVQNQSATVADPPRRAVNCYRRREFWGTDEPQI